MSIPVSIPVVPVGAVFGTSAGTIQDVPWLGMPSSSRMPLQSAGRQHMLWLAAVHMIDTHPGDALRDLQRCDKGESHHWARAPRRNFSLLIRDHGHLSRAITGHPLLTLSPVCTARLRAWLERNRSPAPWCVNGPKRPIRAGGCMRPETGPKTLDCAVEPLRGFLVWCCVSEADSRLVVLPFF